MADVIATHLEMARSGVDKFYPIFGKDRRKWYTQIGFRPETTSMQFIRMFQEGGYGFATVVNEGGAIPVDTFATVNNKDYYWVKRGLQDRRSYESISTDQYGLSKKVAKKMAKAMESTKDSTAAAMFNNHLSTDTAFVGPDGKAFVASDHGLEGGTWSNLGVDASNTNADLSMSALDGMIQQLMLVPNHRGIPDPQPGPFNLMVHPKNASLATRISETLKIQGSANNDVNFGGALISNVIANPFLTDTGAFWLIPANSDDHGLFMLRHDGRLVESERHKETQEVSIFLTEKWLFHFMDARGVQGSAGA